MNRQYIEPGEIPGIFNGDKRSIKVFSLWLCKSCVSEQFYKRQCDIIYAEADGDMLVKRITETCLLHKVHI